MTALSTLLLSACSLTSAVLGDRSSYQQPAYEVVAQLPGGGEVRRYAPRLAAEATVPRGDGDNDAFRLLFRYISGANESAGEIAMTTPVETKRVSSKIAMTTPVEVDDSDTSMTMRFFLPAEFTLENAPRPTDPRVRLVLLAPESFAALRVRGAASRKSLERKGAELSEIARSAGYVALGEPSILYYDPPFTLPMRRQTDIIVPVSLPGEE